MSNASQHTTRVSLSLLRMDGDAQTRVALDQDTVRDYAILIKDGIKLPPVQAMYDGKDYWLYNGYHRCEAHVLAGIPDIDVEVSASR